MAAISLRRRPYTCVVSQDRIAKVAGHTRYAAALALAGKEVIEHISS
jgi:hypothetical protein